MSVPARRGIARVRRRPRREQPMSRYTAPLGFTIVAIWIAVIFVLVSGGTH
jgi:hypothetical protein